MNHILKLQDLKGAVFPVVFPTNNDVTFVRVMTVIPKMGTFVLELNCHMLPLVIIFIETTLSFAIRE